MSASTYIRVIEGVTHHTWDALAANNKARAGVGRGRVSCILGCQ
jgi:hypothetical protein